MNHDISHGMLVAFYHGSTTIKKGVYKNIDQVHAELLELAKFYKNPITYKILRRT